MSREDESRFRFILSLNQLSEGARAHLLRLESDVELVALFQVALVKKQTDVAASIEVEADSRH